MDRRRPLGWAVAACLSLSCNTSETGSGHSGGAGQGAASQDTADSAGGGGGLLNVSICRYRCRDDADCAIGGMDLGYTCIAESCRLACTEDADCLATISGWHARPCESDDDCGGDQCMDLGNGFGGCAPAASETCGDDQTLIDAFDIDGERRAVCAADHLECGYSGRCQACGPDCELEGCAEGFKCDYVGLCGCETDESCVNAGIGDVCSPLGRCFWTCATPEDCPLDPIFADLERRCQTP